MNKTAFLKTTTGVASSLMALAAHADSFWNHNGSTMRLQAYGQERVMRYEIPTERMRNAGAESGTILLTAQRIGNRYQGTARVFTKFCPEPLLYAVAGPVVNEGTIVLYGQRPGFSAHCGPDGTTRPDRLVFTLQR